MNLYTFLDEHLVFAGCMLLVLLLLSYQVLELIRISWIRWMRYLAIRKAGWPPPHCDADGDPVENNSENSG